MIEYEYCPLKNKLLIEKRRISFEIIIDIIKNLGVIDDINHINEDKYPGQKIYIIKYNNYIYKIPYIRKGNKIFLKTIYADRKLTKRLLSKEYNYDEKTN